MPRVEVIGVHSLQVTPELIDRTLEQLHGFVPEGEDRADLEPYGRNLVEDVVLIEAFVHERDSRFNVGDFMQVVPGISPPGGHQVAWLETFLSEDGTTRLVEERELVAPPPGDLRVAFYIHFWRADVPLSTTYGEVKCPPVTPMPDRLRTLAPYEAPA